jgi:predicted transcriptional regulator
MADNNIVYKIIVDSESGTATIRDLKGQIVATQVPVNKLKENFNDLTVSINKNKNATDGNVVAHKNSELTLNAEISKLNSLRSALDISSKEYVEMGNTIDLLNQKKDSLRRRY